MNSLTLGRLFLACCLMYLVPGSARGDSAQSWPEDQAFSVFCDLNLVSRAIAKEDAALLCDVGLQLAEGERRLLRNHRSGLTSRDLLLQSLQIAAKKGDDQTVGRIAKAAQLLNDSSLSDQVAAAKKLGGSARNSQPAVVVDVETFTPEQFAMLQKIEADVNVALAVDDKAELEELQTFLNSVPDLPESLSEAMKGRISEASEQASDQPSDNPLHRLLASSRGSGATGFYFASDHPRRGAHYNMGEEELYFFCVPFVSKYFTAYNAHQAYLWGKKRVEWKGTMYAGRNVRYRTTDSRHIVIGWYNATQDKGGWVAVTHGGWQTLLENYGPWYDRKTRRIRKPVTKYLVYGETSKRRTSMSWVKRTFTSRGYDFRLSVAADSNGDVVLGCTSPR